MYRLTRFSLAHPRLVLAGLLATTLLLALGLPRLRTEFGYRALIGDDHPAIRTLDDFIGRFGGALPLQIVWECRDGSPCKSALDRASVEMAWNVTERLRALDVVRDVTGIANAPLLAPSVEGFRVRRFVENGVLAGDASELALRAKADSRWIDTLISSDGLVASVIVQPTDNASETDHQLVEALEEILAPYRSMGFKYHLVGDSVSAVVSGRELAESTARLIPFMVIAIGAVVLWLTRSWLSALAVLLTIGIALIWTFGFLGWIGWPRDAILEVLAPLILVIGVCDGVHLLSLYTAELGLQQRPDPSRRKSAMLEAARDVGPACLLTTLTTTAAMLSFATSALATFHRFGIVTAFGVVACLVLTFSLLGILGSAIVSPGPRAVRASESWRRVLAAIVDAGERRAITFSVVSAFLLVIFGVGWLAFLRVDTDFYESFGERSQVMRWTRFVEDHLRPSDSLEVSISLDPAWSLEEIRTIQLLSEFSTYLSRIPGLGEARSVLDLVAQANRLMHGDDPSWEKPANTTAGNAELIELITMNGEEVLGDWLSLDRTRVRISVAGSEQSYENRKRVLEAVRSYAAEELPGTWEIALTGEIAIGYDWIRDVHGTQLRSFPTAFITVFVFVAIFLRSLRLALAAMIPVLLPVVVTLGAMGWVGMSLDVGRTMIAAVLIGIGVDDAIHILSHYKLLRSSGEGPGEAIRRSIDHVGRAVITTSFALALGFMTLTASAWQTLSSFGFFVALAIVGALAGTLFLLPALVFAFNPGERGRGGRAAPLGRGRAAVGRRLAAFLAVLSVTGAIAGSSVHAIGNDRGPEFACWILPNARVLPIPGSSGCPLGPDDAIRMIRVEDGGEAVWTGLAPFVRTADTQDGVVRVGVVRSGKEDWVEIKARRPTTFKRLVGVASAALFAIGFLFIPLFLLRHSESQALAPLLLLFGSVATISVVAMSARSSGGLAYLAVAAIVVIPGILVHLNFTFLRARSLLSDAPGVTLAPYAFCGVLLLPGGWFALERDPLLWPPFFYLISTLTGGAAAALLLSSVFVIRESSSPLERSRARVLLWGALLLPVVPTLLLARYAVTVSEVITSYLWAAAVTIPAPIGLAISRYNLFDLGDQLRSSITRVLYLAVGAALFSMALHLTQPSAEGFRPVLSFTLGFVCMVGVEAVRRRLLGYLEARVSPRSVELRRLGTRFFDQVRELREPGEVAELLGRTLHEGLRGRGLSVFLEGGSGWCLVTVKGDNPPARMSVAESAHSVVEGRKAIQLIESCESGDPAALELAAAGAELIVALRRGREDIGLVIVAGAVGGNAYSGTEIGFATAMAEQASLALHNARLAEELVDAELRAGTARVALTLVHQLGKELDWIRALARRLPLRLSDEARSKRDAERIRDLADDVAQRARGFLEGATQQAQRRPGTRSLAAVLDRCCELVSQRFETALVTRTVAPGLDWVPVSESVESAVLNLVDNALRASPAEKPVHLMAAREGAWLEITVADQGAGMSPDVLRRSTDYGFSTRVDGDGHGLGLAVSKESIEALGGRLEIESELGKGTRATIRLPMDSAFCESSRAQ